jgi:hypothetical protein
MKILNIGLKPQNEYSYQPSQSGLMGGLLQGGLAGLAGGMGGMGGMALGSKMFGNPFQQQGSDIFSKINPTKFQAWLQQNPDAMQQWQ